MFVAALVASLLGPEHRESGIKTTYPSFNSGKIVEEVVGTKDVVLKESSRCRFFENFDEGMHVLREMRQSDGEMPYGIQSTNRELEWDKGWNEFCSFR